jgi:hypothetical protein
VSNRLLSIDGPFGAFADRLLELELPDLPADRRSDTVVFICRRARELPTPLHMGVTALMTAVGLLQRLVGLDRTTRFLRATPLPFVGELARMARSLGFAFIWESWPDTSPTGAGPDEGSPA